MDGLDTLCHVLVQGASDGVYAIDPGLDFRVVFMNDATRRLYGPERVTDGHLPDWDPALVPRETLEARWREIGERGSLLFRGSLDPAQKAALPLELSATRIAYGGRSLVCGFVRPVRDQGEAEQVLREQSRKLARSNAELEAFAYVVSHDLREPLRHISSYLTLLERRFGELLTGEAREFLGFARDGAIRMDRLICDLLEFSRIGRITRPMSPVDLAEVLSQSVRVLTIALEEAQGVVTVADGLPIVIGDGMELSRLFQNLLSNAIKYRDPARPPRIAVSAAPVEGGWDIVVADNGIGIAPEHFDRIFGIFQRLHPPGTYEGTGIGLAICKRIAEHHNGRITVESCPGQGSVFHVILPTPAPVVEGTGEQ